MAKYQKVAAEIRRMIRDRGLRPGDLMPSERDLAKNLRVSHNTVRSATDLLNREGVLHRAHGRGTYLAQPKRKNSKQQRRHRLGLLYVDLSLPVHPYSQELTFAIQRMALKAGYELVIEEMRTEDLLEGKVPEMVRRRSVDAVLLEGRVRDHHIRFLENHSLLYLVLGNCPLGGNVPQVRSNIEQLAFEMTRELCLAGRRPVWLDADPSKADLWHVDLERFRGYSRAMKDFAPGGSLHLCPIEHDSVAQSAAMLCRSGLTNAAIIVDHWSSALLPAALAMHSSNPHELLIAPSPNRPLCQALKGPNIIEWSTYIEAAERVAEQVSASLIPLIEGRAEQLHSVSLEMNCKLVSPQNPPRMELSAHWEKAGEFSAEQYGQGRTWRYLDSAAPVKEISETTNEST